MLPKQMYPPETVDELIRMWEYVEYFEMSPKEMRFAESKFRKRLKRFFHNLFGKCR